MILSILYVSSFSSCPTTPRRTSLCINMNEPNDLDFIVCRPPQCSVRPDRPFEVRPGPDRTSQFYRTGPDRTGPDRTPPDMYLKQKLFLKAVK